MKKLRVVISFLLVLALVFGLVPVPFNETSTVFAVETPTGPTSGTCGDNITWTLTEDTEADWDLAQGAPYKLTITGKGEMVFETLNRAPWRNYRSFITSVSISNGITTIADYAFYECVSLTSVNIPASVTSIGEGAFEDNNLLESVTFGKGLTTIGECAFLDCHSLTNITLPDNVSVIGDYAFRNCNLLDTVVCGTGLKTIGIYAFADSALKTIELKEGLETIGDCAFYYCYNLKTLSIPSSVTSIGTGILCNTAVGSIEVAEGNSCFQVWDNVLYEVKEDGTPYSVIAYAPAAEADIVSVMEGTEVIYTYAFSFSRNLTSVVLPSTLKTIKERAFSYCKILEEMNIPDNVEIIESQAFYSCTSLNKISIGKNLQELLNIFQVCGALNTITVSEENPYMDSIDNVVYNEEHTHLYIYAPAKQDTVYYLLDTVESLSSYSINNTSSLEELYMPQTLSSIPGGAIYNNKSLKNIYFSGDAPTISSSYSIKSNADNLIIYRTEASVGWDDSAWSSYVIADWAPENTYQEEGTFGEICWLYEGDIGRISFTGAGEIPDFTEEEPAPWNDYMEFIQTIESSEGITGIGSYAFYNAEKLLRMEADGSLERIGDYAFTDCTNQLFTDISAVETIGLYAFQNNASLRGSLVLEKVSSIGAGAFNGCSSITDVTLGVRLNSLEKEVFADCIALNSFIIPESVAKIKEGALRGCTSLRTVNIPANVNTIEMQAFSGDTALEKVYFYGIIPKNWAIDSFENCNNELTIYYRKSQNGWAQLGEAWNGFALLGLERFYTERKDHYSFNNSASSFGYEEGYRVPRQRYVDVLDSIIIGTYYYAINTNWQGSCYGMVSSTLEFYENAEFDVADYDSTAKNLYDIAAPGNKNAKLTKLIEAYQISQYKSSIAGYNGSISRNINSYKELIRKVEEFERSGGLRIDSEAEPVVMLLYSRCGGHVVVPVSVDQAENGDFLLKVYDPNYPSALRALTIYKDFSGISYDIYTSASYINYAVIAKAMSGVVLYDNTQDNSLYLSIDKENGTVTNENGDGIEKIEGAYEQKSLSGETEDTFSGIKSFVLPQGNYQLTVEESEDSDNVEAAEDSEETVTFYMASEENFAEIASSDENAVLTVKETGTESGELEIEIQSESTGEETTSFTIMNQQGMERTVEVQGGEAVLTIAKDDTITVQVPEDEEVSVDGKLVEIKDGQAQTGFEASEGESSLKIKDFEAEADCDSQNKLNGSVSATVISNEAALKNVTFTVDYYEENGQKVAAYSEDKQLNAGMNSVELSFEALETNFGVTEGETVLSCQLKVTDEEGNTVTAEENGIPVVLTKQQEAVPPEDTEEEPVTPPEDTEEEPVTPPEDTEEEPVTPPEDTEKKPVASSEGTEGKPVAPSENTNKEPVTSSSDKKIAVKKVSVATKTLTIGVGETFTLKASVTPKNATNKKLTYKASNKNITISAKGKITGKKAGKAKVTVTASNGKKTIVKVVVKKAPKTFTLNAKRKQLAVGKSFQIKVKLPKNTASNKITYTSNKKSVATVSSTGKIIAKKQGTAIITCKTFNGVKKRLKISILEN